MLNRRYENRSFVERKRCKYEINRYEFWFFPKKFTPLHIASEKGHYKIAEFLVLNGIDIESRDSRVLLLIMDKHHCI